MEENRIKQSICRTQHSTYRAFDIIYISHNPKVENLLHLVVVTGFSFNIQICIRF